ncbi:uncharacterized protein [Aristolochia californica]|uniref:uncharacterized protein isoform X2 n=1 Tax=Aristolochia californica TaxID=171875 RepID=UPI0035D6D4D6
MLKGIETLCKSEETTCHRYLGSKVCEVGDSVEDSSGFGCNSEVKVEVSSMERRVITHGQRNFQMNDAESPNDADDFSFNEVTLKDLRSICKLRKKKVKKSVDSQQSDVNSFSQHHGITVKIEEDPEMEETLSCLKLKLSNTKPKRRNKLLKKPHPLSEATGSVKVSAEQDIAGKCALNRIKIEMVDMDSYVTETIAVVDKCSAATCSLDLNISCAPGNDLHKVVDGGGTDTEQSSFIEEVNLSGKSSIPLPEVEGSSDSGNTTSSAPLTDCPVQCTLNEVSKDYMKSELPEAVCGNAEESCQGATVMSYSETILDGSPLLISELKMDDEATCSLSGGSHCTVSDENLAVDHVSNLESSCACDFSDEGFLMLETQKNVQPTIISDHGDHSVGDMNKLHIASQNFLPCLPSNNFPDFLMKEDEGSLTLSSSVAMVFPEAAEAKDALTHSLSTGGSVAVSDQNCTIEPQSNFGNGGFESFTNDTLPVVESQTINDKESTSIDHDNNSINNIILLESTPQYFTSCFSSSGSSHFSDNNSCFVMDNVVGAQELSSCATRDTVAEAPDGFDGLKLGISPTRLLSTRKAISPLSQEKLLHAVDAEELQPNMLYSKGKKRLCFRYWNKNESFSARPDPGSMECRQERSKKSRPNLKNGSPPSVIKGILKTHKKRSS